MPAAVYQAAGTLTSLDRWAAGHRSREVCIERDNRRGIGFWEVWMRGSGREFVITEVEIMTTLERPGLAKLIQAALAEAERRGL